MSPHWSLQSHQSRRHAADPPAATIGIPSPRPAHAPDSGGAQGKSAKVERPQREATLTMSLTLSAYWASEVNSPSMVTSGKSLRLMLRREVVEAHAKTQRLESKD